MGYFLLIHLDKPHALQTLFQQLPSHKPNPTASDSALFNSDYRFGPLRIDWLDLTTRMNDDEGGQHNPKRSEPSPGESGHGEPSTANLINNSGSTNLPKGTVHLFRDAGS